MLKLFSDFLPESSLNKVNIYSYFHTLSESSDNDKEIVKLLPSDHAIAYPLEFNPKNGEIVNGKVNFYNKPLYQNIVQATEIPEEKVKLKLIPNKDKVIIANLLDNCYGHSFLKLLNLYHLHKNFGKEYDIIAITPSCLSYLIPKDKFYICSINLSFTELEKCYNLKKVLQTIKVQYKKHDFAVMNTYENYHNRKEISDFFRFSQEQPSIQGEKYITFYYRKNKIRMWDGKFQRKKITRLFKHLRPYFDDSITLCVVGEKDNFSFPDWITDKRISEYSYDTDIIYNQIFKNSSITIGVTGSHLLIPSLLSNIVFHLVPSHKLHNAMEDTINYSSPIISSWYENITLFGNSSLSNYSSKKLACYILILYQSSLDKKYKSYFTNQLKENTKIQSQKEYMAQNFSFFNYQKCLLIKEQNEKQAYYSMKFRTLLQKLIPF